MSKNSMYLLQRKGQYLTEYFFVPIYGTTDARKAKFLSYQELTTMLRYSDSLDEVKPDRIFKVSLRDVPIDSFI